MKGWAWFLFLGFHVDVRGRDRDWRIGCVGGQTRRTRETAGQ